MKHFYSIDPDGKVQRADGSWEELSRKATEKERLSHWVDVELPEPGAFAFRPWPDHAPNVIDAISSQLPSVLLLNEDFVHVPVRAKGNDPCHIISFVLLQLSGAGTGVEPIRIIMLAGYRTLMTVHEPSPWLSDIRERALRSRPSRCSLSHEFVVAWLLALASGTTALINELEQTATENPASAEDSKLLVAIHAVGDSFSAFARRLAGLRNEARLLDSDHWDKVLPEMAAVSERSEKASERLSKRAELALTTRLNREKLALAEAALMEVSQQTVLTGVIRDLNNQQSGSLQSIETVATQSQREISIGKIAGAIIAGLGLFIGLWGVTTQTEEPVPSFFREHTWVIPFLILAGTALLIWDPKISRPGASGR